jgi:drug/metabolite transporter (DMT)-like permease
MTQSIERPGSGAAVLPASRAYALFGMVSVLWAANWPIMKWGLHFISPLWFAVARFALGALCLFAVLAATRRLGLPRRADLPVMASVGILQMTLFTTLVNLALVHVPAGRSSILAYTTPLWVLPGAVLFLKEKVTRLGLVGLLLGLVGVVVLVNPASIDWSAPGMLAGHLMLLGGAVCWAAAILHVRKHRWASSPLEVAPWQMTLAGLLITPLALVREGPPRFSPTPQLGAVLLYNGPLATAFCFWAAVSMTRALPAVTTSLSFLAVPVMGVVLSTLWLGEPLGAALLLGLAMILAGVGVMTLGDALLRKGRA